MFDKASQATSISSGGLWGCRGGNEQIARGWIIASRERLIVLCRVEEQSAPDDTSKSALNVSGPRAVVSSLKVYRPHVNDSPSSFFGGNSRPSFVSKCVVVSRVS